MPVGFKNGTSGNVRDCDRRRPFCGASALVPVRDQAGRDCHFQTTGNPDAHVILRGGNRTGLIMKPRQSNRFSISSARLIYHPI